HPTADDNQVPRHLVELHDRGGVVHGDVGGHIDLERARPLTDVDHDGLRGKGPGPTGVHRDLDRPVPHEPRLSLDELESLGLPQARLAATPELLDDGALALPNHLHIDGDLASAHAVIGGPPGEPRDAPGGDHRLGRGAPGVDARPSNVLPLDQGRPATARGEGTGERSTFLPGADDDGIERLVRHDGCTSTSTTNATVFLLGYSQDGRNTLRCTVNVVARKPGKSFVTAGCGRCAPPAGQRHTWIRSWQWR